MATIDARPAAATLHAVAGDPFAFRVQLIDAEGDPVDVLAWDWAATVHTGTVRLDFEWATDAQGVRFWLRGDDTARLPPGKPWPFDIAARPPTAGEGVLVLAGAMTAKARVTNPLRSDPEAVPA